jgi:hypothetical protein
VHKNNLLYPTTIRKRIKLEGTNPRTVAIVGDKVYTVGYFSNAVEVFDISLSLSDIVAKISLGSELPLTAERTGAYHFYNGDESHSQGGWLSCHTCHSFTRVNGLDYMLASGVTMQKNTKSLLYSWWTPPMNWAAKRNNCTESIQYGIIQELGKTPADSDITTIGEFLKGLKPMPSPHLVKGSFSESAKRGRDIYYGDKADCKGCHPAPLFTDCKMHPTIVTNDRWDASPNFDTPSIIEAWRTAPWDHIGTTTDFEQLLKKPILSNYSKKLSENEFKDLVEYVLSL